MNNLDQTDRDFWREHYFERFDKRDELEPVFENTRESLTLAKHIDEVEQELRNLRQQAYIAKQAHTAVRNKKRVEFEKAALGIRPEVEAIIEEVYERGQQRKSLQGAGKSWRDGVSRSYGYLRTYVKQGLFASNMYGNRGGNYDKLYVEYELMSKAHAVIGNDNTKKGADLVDRTYQLYMQLWKEWNDAERPIVTFKEDAYVRAGKVKDAIAAGKLHVDAHKGDRNDA